MLLRVPDPFDELLHASTFEEAFLKLEKGVAKILVDNKTVFFPAYTDHGPKHVESLLDSAVRLVPGVAFDPKEKDHDRFNGDDVVALVGAALLHDLGLHLTDEGFLDLVSSDSRFKPLQWFDKRQPGREPDRPWDESWDAFKVEVAHYSTTKLDRLLGPGNDGVPAIAYGDHDLHSGAWTTADRLVIGEFLRRHHARLSHEIAIHGFPAAGDEFPILEEEAPEIADAIGAIARSHNESLHTMMAYFDFKIGHRMRRPSGVLAAYVMALLRIADYLEIGAVRAPTLLLRLRNPQSPQSVEEWKKNAAVQRILWDLEDPHAFFIEVSSKHGLRTHLQLRELLVDLQRELDTSIAVLSEAYPSEKFSAFRLNYHRVYSNLDEESLHEKLPYVPRSASFRSAEDLFRLVVGDLYGNYPAVAGRELLQNAVDAVRQRDRWNDEHGLEPPDLDDSAVVVEVRIAADDSMELAVIDHGIGMTPDTVIDYFLQAGASLRLDADERGEPDRNQSIRWMKAGRFGVGAFAAFLLGPEVRVRTRHVSADRGIEFEGRIDGDLIELKWTDAPVGTEVLVSIDESVRLTSPNKTVREFAHGLLGEIAAYYRMVAPAATYRLVHADGSSEEFPWPGEIPDPLDELPHSWRRLEGVDEFNAVLWTDARPLSTTTGTNFGVGLSHNGLMVKGPTWGGSGSRDGYGFADPFADYMLDPPWVAVFDSRHRLGLTLTRYSLRGSSLPFEAALLASMGQDLLAHALVFGQGTPYPLSNGWGLRPVSTEDGWFPLTPRLVRASGATTLAVLWEPDPFYLRGFPPPGAAGAFRRKLRATASSNLPLRTVLPVDARRASEAFVAERSRWGFSLSDVWDSSDRMARAFDLIFVAGAVLRRRNSRDGSSLSDEEIEEAQARESFSARGRRLWARVRGGSDSDSQTHAWALGGHAPSEYAKDARRVAEEISDEIGGGSVAVSVFAVPAPPLEEPLSDPWRQSVGRVLPNDDDERAKVLDRVSEESATLARRIEAWRAVRDAGISLDFDLGF